MGLIPDATGAIKCPKDKALLASAEDMDKGQGWLRAAPGLIRLFRRQDGEFSARYGLPQRVRRGSIHPPRRRAPGGWTPKNAPILDHAVPLRRDLHFRLQIYCPNCHKGWTIQTWELPDGWLPLPYEGWQESSADRVIRTDKFG